MSVRSCPHCEAALGRHISRCPDCGLDPRLPRLAFEDAPAFFIAGDPRHIKALRVTSPLAPRMRVRQERLAP
jgi:hypothetical protein